ARHRERSYWARRGRGDDRRRVAPREARTTSRPVDGREVLRSWRQTMSERQAKPVTPPGGAPASGFSATAPAAEPPEEEELTFEAPTRGSADELLDAGAHSDLDAMRHSAAHVMAEAVLDLFPGTKLGIGPAIADGFYYDFELPRPLTPDDLPAIEARMAASVAADHPFVRRELSPAEGRALFVERDQPFKVEILDDLAAKATAEGKPMPPVSLYEHGSFSDLCKGPHVASTGRIG